jgi:hypothetical protein
MKEAAQSVARSGQEFHRIVFATLLLGAPFAKVSYVAS